MTNEFPVTQHPAKMGIPDLKSLYSQVWVRYPYFSFFKLCIFTCGFSAKVIRSDWGFKDTVVSRKVSSLHERSLETVLIQSL